LLLFLNYREEEDETIRKDRKETREGEKNEKNLPFFVACYYQLITFDGGENSSSSF